MAVSASRLSGPCDNEFEGARYPERKFSRSAWEKIETCKQDQVPVSMWIGVANIVVAITIADIDPDDLTISALGTRLMLRGTAQSNFFSQNVDLPCAVDINPIRIPGGTGILYILLSKKKETSTVTAGGQDNQRSLLSAKALNGA
jgi:HSP20 family molecular chaperone IbpA